MALYLVNAFSATMLNISADGDSYLRFRELDEGEVKRMLSEGFESAVGHAGTADVLAERLGVPVKANRIPVKLQKAGDRLIVAQIEWPGGRLAEGQVLSAEEVKKLRIKFLLVEDVTLEVKKSLKHAGGLSL
jgi:hypothetical protein